MVPPQFSIASQQLTQQVQSHSGAITGAPGKAYTGTSLQLATPEMYSKQLDICTSHQPVALFKVYYCFYFFSINVIESIITS